ncbi:MAG TPA: YidC/Oxa1 family membrane protein insertase, partial [Planctomycetota bacterium]|nr:YidC/Oxa1 family membrane protein insertase [Planctomycetota bacterium]
MFEKRVAPRAGEWQLDVELALEHLPDAPDGLRPGPRSFWFRPAGVMPPEQNGAFYPEPRAIAIGDHDGPYRKKAITPSASASERTGSFDLPTPLAALGVHNKYFAVLLHAEPDDARAVQSMRGAVWERVQDRELLAAQPERAKESWRFLQTDALLELALPPRGERASWRYVLYAGPKQKETFRAAFDAHRAVIDDDLAWFSSIGNLLLDVLRVFERFTGNWGVAIILLTLGIRLLLFPLNRRSQTAMARYAKKMKRVQPLLKAVQEQYKDDPKKLREEQGRIMQQEGAFPPLGGCLPLFLQMPIFFGLFSALRTSFDLRQAPFASWIQDLSHPDELLRLGWNVPFIDLEYLNLLPILMVVLWVWQQRTMPTPEDEQSRRMQRMLLFMPVVMGVFLYNYAAGLSLYMMTQSGLGIFEQKVIKKFWPIDDTEVQKAAKPGCGCAPFARAMERAAEQQR